MKLDDVQREVKRFTRIQKILISIIIVLVLLGAITLISGGNALSKFGYDAFSMFKYSIIEHPAEVISNWKSEWDELKVTQEKYDEVKKILSSQTMYKAERDEKDRTIKELEALMDLDTNARYDKIYTSVISRDISTWSNTVVINKGSKDGIKVDMAMVNEKGLIGKVSEVNANTSKVKLLTTENGDVSVAVKVELKEGTSEGILENYNAKNGIYNIQLFDTNAKVEKGMNVITSGNGGVFPPGVIVGKVKEVEESYTSKGKTIIVKPSVDFNDFTYAAILKVK